MNGLFFLLANVTPFVNTAASLYPVAVDLTSRTCEGNVDDVGVDGRTLMEFLGERGDFRLILFNEADDVEEAFEWVLLWKERIEDTEDDVEVLPPSPRPEERRYGLGVSCGEREFLLGGGVLRWAAGYRTFPREFLRAPLLVREPDCCCW